MDIHLSMLNVNPRYVRSQRLHKKTQKATWWYSWNKYRTQSGEGLGVSQLLFFKAFSFFFDPIWLPDHVTNDIIFIKAYFPWVVDQLVTFCINQLSGFSPKIFPSIQHGCQTMWHMMVILMKILFKFQVNPMKIEDFRNLAFVDLKEVSGWIQWPEI